MKKAKSSVFFRKLPIAPGGGIAAYLIVLVCCAIFTQALRSPVSAVAYTLVLALPIADLIVFAVSWFFVSARVSGIETVASKGDKLCVPIIIANNGIIPVSFAEASLSIPDEKAIKCETVVKKLALPPLSQCETGVHVSFRYRGLYRLGTEELYLHDFFRLIRVRKKVSSYTQIRVLPNRLSSCDVLPPSDGTGETVSSALEMSKQNEYGDIRQYRPGDGIKNIHWKLSTKTEELQVRKYASDNGRGTAVFCDFGGQYTAYPFAPDAAAFSDDRIAEEALSAVWESATAGLSGCLVWSDRTAPGGIAAAEYSDQKTAEKLAFRLSEIDAENALPGLSELSLSSYGMTALLVTSFRSPDTERTIRKIASDCGASQLSVCLCDLSPLLEGEEQEQYRNDLEALRRRIAAAGIRITVPVRETERQRDDR